MSSLKCLNCGYEYEREDELIAILDIREVDENGDWHTTDRMLYKGQPLEITESHHEEVFYGCAGCLSDENLNF